MTALASPPRTHLLTAGFLMLAMAATVGTALGFQHLGGYIPCKLCLAQREPYYVGVPLMAVALLSSALHWPTWLTRAAAFRRRAADGLQPLSRRPSCRRRMGLVGRPDRLRRGRCAGAGSSSGGVLDQIDEVIPPSCDKASLRILGLSFAGWNAVASFFLALIAFRGALAKG